MARPSRDQERELGRIEDLIACRHRIDTACQVLQMRLAQTGRRIKGNARAIRVFLPVFDELTEIVCANSQINVILAEMKGEAERMRARDVRRGQE